MTSLEQSRHMCPMSQGIFEAQGKLFERRGLGVEDETWSSGFQQLDKVKVSFVNKREFNWLTAVCLICRFLRVGEMLQSTPTQLSVTNSMAKVHPSEGHQAELNGNIGIIALCFGAAFRKEHFKSAHSWGTSTIPSPRLAWSLVGPAPNWMEKHTIVLTFKFAWRAQTQDVCELGATVLPFVRSLFCAASRGPTPCRARGFCEQKDLHGLTLRHKCLRSKLQLHLDPLSTKGEATSLETSHAVAKMTQPVKVNFLSAAF
jgi:hypothetical protein